MLKNPFQVAITFAAVALIIKLTIFSLNMQHGEMESYIRYIYMLVLLTAVFFGIRSNKILENNKTTFLQDFKAGARTASFFAILVAGITYIYYAKIDANFFVIKRQELINSYPAKIEKTLKDKTMTLKEIKPMIHNEIVGSHTTFTPYFQSMWTMFGLVFMGLFNSLVFAFLIKKMPGFKI